MVRERNIKETLKRENSKEEKSPCKYKKKHAHGLQKTDQEAEKISTLINLAQQCIFQI